MNGILPENQALLYRHRDAISSLPVPVLIKHIYPSMSKAVFTDEGFLEEIGMWFEAGAMVRHYVTTERIEFARDSGFRQYKPWWLKQASGSQLSMCASMAIWLIDESWGRN